MIVEIYRTQERPQPWRYKVLVGGEIVGVSEGYVTRWGVRRAARKVFGKDVA